MKKTEFITFRTDQLTKQSLDKLASQKRWTISFLVEEIVKEWFNTKADILKNHTHNTKEELP